MLFADLLKKNLTKYCELDVNEFEKIYSYFKVKIINKKEILLKSGEVCKFDAFVVKGLFRIYFLDNTGNTNTIYFAQENWWISEIDSFINNNPTKLNIEALEDSTILVLYKKDKELLFQTVPKLESIVRKMVQKRAVSLQRRLVDSLSKTADIRYLDFLEEFPSLANKLTNIQIASYLGISHEFLSKIRSKLSGKLN